MSPMGILENIDSAGFPRVSGDEPDALKPGHNTNKFSPRERG